MNPLAFTLSLVVLAGCDRKTGPETASSSAASSLPSATATATPTTGTTTAGTGAQSDACAADEVWSPKSARVDFAWTETPTLDKAPKDGVYAFVGERTEPFKLEQVELWVDKDKGEWALKAKAGPLGPSLTIKGEPKSNAIVTEKFGANRGHFQVPRGRIMASCYKQTTSYNGDNARVIKLTRYDEHAKRADGVFITTWRERTDQKRQFWAGGTFTDAKVVFFK